MTNLKLGNERDRKTSSDHQITEGEVDYSEMSTRALILYQKEEKNQ